jgi:hypothetical protein
MNKKTEQKWVFFYDTDHILQEVENITATLASRPIGKEGQSRPYLILNEDASDLFLRLVKDALSDIRTSVYKYLNPEHPSDDIRRVDRIHIHANLTLGDSEDVPSAVRVLDDKIREYLIYRVIFGWLLLKAPDEAQYYQEHTAQVLDDIKHVFNKSGGSTRRRYHLF